MCHCCSSVTAAAVAHGCIYCLLPNFVSAALAEPCLISTSTHATMRQQQVYPTQQCHIFAVQLPCVYVVVHLQEPLTHFSWHEHMRESRARARARKQQEELREDSTPPAPLTPRPQPAVADPIDQAGKDGSTEPQAPAPSRQHTSTQIWFDDDGNPMPAQPS
jgi:hypothetical protein